MQHNLLAFHLLLQFHPDIVWQLIVYLTRFYVCKVSEGRTWNEKLREEVLRSGYQNWEFHCKTPKIKTKQKRTSPWGWWVIYKNNLWIRKKGKLCSVVDHPSAVPPRSKTSLGSRGLAQPRRRVSCRCRGCPRGCRRPPDAHPCPVVLLSLGRSWVGAKMKSCCKWYWAHNKSAPAADTPPAGLLRMSGTSAGLLGSPRDGNLGSKRCPRRPPSTRGPSSTEPRGETCPVHPVPQSRGPGRTEGPSPRTSPGHPWRRYCPSRWWELAVPQRLAPPRAWLSRGSQHGWPAAPLTAGGCEGRRGDAPRIAAEPLRTWTSIPMVELSSALLCMRRDRAAPRDFLAKKTPPIQPKTHPRTQPQTSK